MSGAPRFLDRNRASKPGVSVAFTVEEAALAEEALNHVAREIFGDGPKGDRLRDAAAAIGAALPPGAAR